MMRTIRDTGTYLRKQVFSNTGFYRQILNPSIIIIVYIIIQTESKEWHSIKPKDIGTGSKIFNVK